MGEVQPCADACHCTALERLSIAESLALQTVAAAGLPAASRKSCSVPTDNAFCEIERFDRIGEEGRGSDGAAGGAG
ncbi:hypothetical protein M8494_24535 [Serratia ureilytica]